MVIFAPAGSAPWLAVSFTHVSISLRSVDCARPSDGKTSNIPSANKRTKPFFIPISLRFTGWAPRTPIHQKALAELLIFSAPSFQAKRLEDDTVQIV